MNIVRCTLTATALAAIAVGFAGCTTATRRYAANETRQTVSGFSEEDINDTVSRAVQSICSQDRIKLQAGANRAVATVKVEPQYLLRGRLTQRSLRQDNEDVQAEFNLNLTLIDLQTGTEFWQKRVHVGKLVAPSNLM